MNTWEVKLSSGGGCLPPSYMTVDAEDATGAVQNANARIRGTGSMYVAVSAVCAECGERDCSCAEWEREHGHDACGRFHCSECKRCDVPYRMSREPNQSSRGSFWVALSVCCEAELVHGNGREVLPEEIE